MSEKDLGDLFMRGAKQIKGMNREDAHESEVELPCISVIIPHLENSSGLNLCLEALNRQTYPRDRFEVVVIDNGSSAQTQSELSRIPGIIYIVEPKEGAYAARNKGIAIATGEVLAFTDSDCIPDPNWLMSGVRVLLSSSQIGLVGGEINVFCARPNKPTPTELWEMLTAFDQEYYIGSLSFAATANMFSMKSRFHEVGLFNGELKSGGDLEWGNRIARHNLQLIYCDGARVGHPARRNLRELYLKMRRVAEGHRACKRKGEGSFLVSSIANSVSLQTKEIFNMYQKLWRRRRELGLAAGIKMSAFVFIFLFLRLKAIAEARWKV